MVHFHYGLPVHLPQLPTSPRGVAVEVVFCREQSNSTGGTFTRVSATFIGAASLSICAHLRLNPARLCVRDLCVWLLTPDSCLPDAFRSFRLRLSDAFFVQNPLILLSPDGLTASGTPELTPHQLCLELCLELCLFFPSRIPNSAFRSLPNAQGRHGKLQKNSSATSRGKPRQTTPNRGKPRPKRGSEGLFPASTESNQIKPFQTSSRQFNPTNENWPWPATII